MYTLTGRPRSRASTEGRPDDDTNRTVESMAWIATFSVSPTKSTRRLAKLGPPAVARDDGVAVSTACAPAGRIGPAVVEMGRICCR
jgi:hypothetical protein